MKGLVERSPLTASWIKSLVLSSMDMSEADGIGRESILVQRSWMQRKKHSGKFNSVPLSLLLKSYGRTS